MANDKIFRTIGGIIGNIDARYTPTGKLVVKFGIGMCDPADLGSKELKWISCTAWEDTGKQIENTVQKGDKLIVSGPVEQYNDRWTLTVWDWAKLERKPRESKPASNPGYERLPDRSSGLAHPTTADDDQIPF